LDANGSLIVEKIDNRRGKNRHLLLSNNPVTAKARSLKVVRFFNTLLFETPTADTFESLLKRSI